MRRKTLKIVVILMLASLLVSTILSGILAFF